MGLFRRKKRVACPQGRWTTLIQNYTAGMPATFQIAFISQEGQPVRGTYQERRAFWIFPLEPTEGPLQPQMAFQRNWINAYYRIQVCAETDLIAEIE